MYSAIGAIGQSVLSSYNLVNFGYNSAVQSGAVAGAIGIPANGICSLLICGGEGYPPTTDSCCLGILQNWHAAVAKQLCFAHGSCAYVFTGAVCGTGISTGFFVAGAAITGAAVTSTAITEAAAIAAVGSVILSGSVNTSHCLVHTVMTGKVDCCTPVVKCQGSDDPEEDQYVMACPAPLRFSCCMTPEDRLTRDLERMIYATTTRSTPAPAAATMTRDTAANLSDADVQRIADRVAATMMQNAPPAVPVGEVEQRGSAANDSKRLVLA